MLRYYDPSSGRRYGRLPKSLLHHPSVFSDRQDDAAKEPMSGGPTILVDRPRPGLPTPPPSDFPFGPATLWRRVQSRGAMGVRAELFNPSPAGRSRRGGSGGRRAM